MNLREHERASIRAFVHSAADEGYLSGRVLDYGCGTGPYRRIVEEHGGEYVGFDRADYPANVSGQDIGPALTFGVTYDAVLCTQVIQYAPEPSELLQNMRTYTVAPGGVLVMTYPTNWPEVEQEDLHRFTKAGMERLLTEAGFTILRHERRAFVFDPWMDVAPGKRMAATGEEFALGYGVVARA